MPAPLYTPANCTNPAYQLDWSYSIFWKVTPEDFTWLDELQTLTTKDDVRILQHEFKPPHTSQFLISTRPNVAPAMIWRVKGRLQHLIRATLPQVFRRNYALRSIGSTRRAKLDRYLATQIGHHPMADPRVQERLAQYQIHQPQIDLSQPRPTAHAQYWYNLHIVLVHEERFREIRDKVLTGVRQMILRASEKKGHLLSRAAILPDHVHLTLGCPIDESPEEVVLSYMNNLAFSCGMKPVFKYSYYVGTFSEYDLGVIPRSAESLAPPG